MHRSRIKLLVTATLVSGLAWTALPAVASASTVPVVPSTLPAGPPPGVASIDPATHELTRPGQPSLTVLPDGGWADRLFRVRGGYLVSLRWGVSDHRLVYVGDDGTQRVVRDTWSFSPLTVSSDGRSFIGVQHRIARRGVSEAYVVRRFRTQDARAVGKPLVRPFRDLEPRALVVTPTRVTLVSPHRVGRRGVETRTELWNTRTGSVRVIAKHLNTAAQDVSLLTWAASTRAHVVGVERGRRQVALDSRARKPLWRTRPGEALLPFAPDDRSVATVSDGQIVDQGTIGAVKRLSVRSARTGQVLADFAGFFTFRSDQLPSAQSFGWETSDSFIAYAYDDLVWGDDSSSPVGGGLVRCTVSTASCERIGDSVSVPAVGPSH